MRNNLNKIHQSDVFFAAISKSIGKLYPSENHIARSSCLLVLTDTGSCNCLTICLLASCSVFLQVSCLVYLRILFLFIDVDECEQGTDVCVNAECTNTVGSYTCRPCFPGFSIGDATACSKPKLFFVFSPLFKCMIGATYSLRILFECSNNLNGYFVTVIGNL